MKLKQARNEAGLSQQALSKKTGIPQYLISKYENGEILPNHINRNKIEFVLGKIDWSGDAKIRLKKPEGKDPVISVLRMLPTLERHELQRIKSVISSILED